MRIIYGYRYRELVEDGDREPGEVDGHYTEAEGARREGEQAAGSAPLRGDSGGDGGGQALPQDSGPSDG